MANETRNLERHDTPQGIGSSNGNLPVLPVRDTVLFPHKEMKNPR